MMTANGSLALSLIDARRRDDLSAVENRWLVFAERFNSSEPPARSQALASSKVQFHAHGLSRFT